jgi:hypothetical protein
MWPAARPAKAVAVRRASADFFLSSRAAAFWTME